MINEFPFGTSQQGKRDYLFRISVCCKNFPVGRTKKRFHLHPIRNFREFVVNGKQPQFFVINRFSALLLCNISDLQAVLLSLLINKEITVYCWLSTGTTNDDFLLSALNTRFRLSRVLLDL